MQPPVTTHSIERLLLAAEQVGMSVEDMIRILNAGISVESLLHLIERRLQASEATTGSSRLFSFN
jgi:hypothetical protein